MFGLCWASLFFLAALVSCVHILKTVIKTHYPRAWAGILVVPDIQFHEET